MLGCRDFLNLLIASVLLAPGPHSIAWAADANAKPEGGKVAGILIDRKDNWISVKADGEEEPVKYLTGDASDQKLAAALKSIFSVCRVELTYKIDGNSRILVSIKRHVGKDAGTMTGEVVKNMAGGSRSSPSKGCLTAMLAISRSTRTRK